MGIERFRFDGKRCVVTGAASGMGEATAQALVELGGEVYGLDIAPVKVTGIAKSLEVDLKDPKSIENVLDAIGGPIHALASVAGLPGAPFSEIDTITVNFIGARHLIETAFAKGMLPEGSAVSCVTSFAGNGWEMQWGNIQSLVAETPDFADAVSWCEANSFGGYAPSKVAMNAYVGWRNAALLKQGIRINAVGPGVTQTGMSKHFVAQMGEEFFENFPKPIGRDSRPDEQAYPVVFTLSDAASYLSGAIIYTDGGLGSGMATGAITMG